jgi:hypothetical protein
MERVSEPTLFSFFSGQCLNWLQIEVVIQMQIVEILSVNQQVQHVVALTTYLKSGLNPVKFRQLEKLRGLERFEEIAFVL